MILISIICTIIYALTNLLLGFMLLRLGFLRQMQKPPVLIILITSFLFGQGVLMAVWLVLGLLGWFKLPLILGIMILILLASVVIWRDLIIYFKTLMQNSLKQFKALSIFWKTITLMISCLILFLAAGAIILPLSGDAAGFYLSLPKIMAYTGKLIPQPNQYDFSTVSMLGEMHFAALIVIADFMAAKLFVWFNALAVAGLVLGLGRLINLKTKGQIIALAILFTSLTFTVYLIDGKVDIFGAAYGLAAYYWILKTRDKSWLPLVLVGLFTGLAVTAKLSNIFVIIPGALVVLIWHRLQEFKNEKLSFRKFLAKTGLSLMVVGVCFILALAPHLIKNKILFNNAFVTPYTVAQFMRVINPTWSPVNNFASTSYSPPKPSSASGWALFTIKKTFVVFLASPIALAFWENPSLNDNMSILFLALFPFLLICYPKNIAQKQILAMAGSGLLIWIIIRSSVVIPRYYLATLCLFLPLIAAGVQNFLDKKNYLILKIVINGSIFLVLISFLVTHFYMIKLFGQFATGKGSVEKLNPSDYAALQFLNQTVATGDRILFTGYPVFYLRPDLLVNLGTSDELNHLTTIDKDSAWQYLADRGFKYFVFEKAIPILPIEDIQNNYQPSWLKIKKIYTDREVDIYAIEAKSVWRTP